MIARIFMTAILGGVLAGLFLTVVQQIQVTPMILEAETYEQGAPASDIHADTGAQAAAEEDEAWAPGDGMERLTFTALANILTAVAFGLFLAAGYALRGRVDWRQGILWGGAGYLAFNLAPALGLPPELPGAAAAPLVERQIWWILTAAATIGGLGIIAFVPRSYVKALGAVLIVAPHVVGAPQPEIHGGLAPAELEQAYIYASLITNAVFWIALGVFTGYLFNRFRPEAGVAG